MPTPRADETQDEFVARCIPVVIEDGTAEDQEQAVAVCNSMWQQDSKAGELHRYTYNGVTCQATRRRSSSRDDKAWMRNVKKGDKERLVHYADPDMPMRRNNEEARENFLARHNCDTKRDPFAPGFWSCYDWANPDEKQGVESDNTMSKTDKAQEHKTLPFIVTKIDSDQGIVEHTVAVMGNVDLGGDRIHPGAFTKTISERAGKIRVLDAHQSDSVLNVIGKPLALWEVGRDGLDAKIRTTYPDATGALMARTQFLMDTPEGKGAFARIRDGAVDEYSIGYDPITADYTEEERDGKSITVRNLKEIRLWEYSPVAFAMNPATSTLSAKEAADMTAEQVDEKAVTDPLSDKEKSDPPRYVGKEDEPEESKVGRAISAANARRIQGAIDAAQEALSDLEALLRDTMPQTENDEPEDEQAKDAPPSASTDEPGAATGQETEAEPQDDALTSEELMADIDALMGVIEKELSEVET